MYIAVNRQFCNGVREQNLKLMEFGSQQTSTKFIKNCSFMKMKQAFTSYGNPKGDVDTEMVMRTIKEELVWLNALTSPDLFFKFFENCLDYYNKEYLYSTL